MPDLIKFSPFEPDEYSIVPLPDEDESTGAVESTAPQTHRRLLAHEKVQLAVWIVEGASNSKIINMMVEHGMPAISQSALTKYRSNGELLEHAKTMLRQQVTTVGLAEKAVRVRKLQRHAERLESLILETGLMETTTKITGYERANKGVAGNPLTSVETKFAATLSREYRDTLKQIADEVEPLQRLVVGEQTNNFFINMNESDRQQMREAMLWVPRLQPVVVESEARAIDDIDAVDVSYVEHT